MGGDEAALVAPACAAADVHPLLCAVAHRTGELSLLREEFAPDTAMDFDANCGFRYQHSVNALHDVDCNTAVGDGRLHVKAELPGIGKDPEAVLEVKDVPVLKRRARGAVRLKRR